MRPTSTPRPVRSTGSLVPKLHLGTASVHEVALRLFRNPEQEMKLSFPDSVRAQVQLGHEDSSGAIVGQARRLPVI